MSLWVEIALKGGVRRTPLGSMGGQPKVVGSGAMKIELEKDGTWRLVPPLHPEWRFYIPDWPGGRWDENMMNEVHLYSREGKECFLLRKYELSDGPAFYDLQDNGSYGVTTTWKRAAKPFSGKTGCWSGIAVKGAAGVVLGAEDVPTAVVSWDDWHHGGSFNIISGRLGLVGGFSGGAALVIVTGFDDIQELDGFSVSGSDWTLSIGAKAKGLEKLGSTGPLLSRMVQGISKFDDVIRKVKDEEKAKELVTAGKSTVQSLGYDWEEKSVSVIDVPLLGAGAEAGFYWYWGSCKLFSRW